MDPLEAPTEKFTLEYERASNAICRRIAMVAHSCRTPRVTSAAKTAADAITDALRGAAGDPDSPRWSLAFARLAEFLCACGVSTSPAFVELQQFLNENVDLRQEAIEAEPSEREGAAVARARQLQHDC